MDKRLSSVTVSIICIIPLNLDLLFCLVSILGLQVSNACEQLRFSKVINSFSVSYTKFRVQFIRFAAARINNLCRTHTGNKSIFNSKIISSCTKKNDVTTKLPSRKWILQH